MEFSTSRHTAREHTHGVSVLAWNGIRLYSASKDTTIKEWDLNGNCLRSFTGHTRWIRCLVLTNGRMYSGSWDGSVREWDLNTGTCLRVFEDVHEGGVNSVILDDQGQRLYSGGEDGAICIHDLVIGDVVDRWEGSDPILALSSLGNLFVFASHSNGTLSLFDASNFELLETTVSSSSEATALAVVADRLYSANNDKTVREFDVDDWVAQRVFRGHLGFVASLVGSAGTSEGVDASRNTGPRLFSGDSSGTVKVWDLVTGSCLGTLRAFDGRSASSLCLVEEHNLLLVGGSNGEIKWFHLSDLPHSFAGSVGQPLPPASKVSNLPQHANDGFYGGGAVYPHFQQPYGQHPYSSAFHNQQQRYESSFGVQSHGNIVSTLSSAGRPPCHFFARGQCRNGDSCRFSHTNRAV
ncbi:quinon protein alcohol dehydrogenase-like superfamily [Obelidium mucronatum]|nr:quinon protein alcohol dehydrogenase-like superfamily [Obelidium mucronatum]